MPTDFVGELYARSSRLQRSWGTKLIETLELNGDEMILDLGCGDGAVSAQWAERVPRGRVVAVDRSSGMLEYAAVHHVRPNLEFGLADLEQLDMGGSRYDLIVSNAALHWVQDHETLLPTLHDLLRPGGRLCLSFGGAGNCQTFFDVARDVMAEPLFADAFEGFLWPWRNETVVAYQRLLATTVFTDVAVWGDTEDTHFQSAEPMIAWMDQPLLVPLLARLPVPLHAPFRATVIERVLTRSARPDGRHFELFRKIQVRARRGGLT